MVTITFRTVKRTFFKTTTCVDCGRTLRRRRTFKQTINPYLFDGATTYQQVFDAIDASEEVQLWRAAPAYCEGICNGKSLRERS